MYAKKVGLYSKIGRKFCYPQVPSNWIYHYAIVVELFQDYWPKKYLLYPEESRKVKNKKDIKIHDYEPHEKYCFLRLHGFCSSNSKNFIARFGYTPAAWCSVNETHIFNLCSIPRPDPIPKSTITEMGVTFDVISMLSSDGGSLIRCNKQVVSDVETTLKGSPILVCCFPVPVFWLNTPLANYLRGLATHFSLLRDYHLVIVAKMCPNWSHDEAAFHHFLSGFPSSCLAIPFHDAARRHRLCSALGFSTHPVVLRVDADQKVVYFESFLESYTGYGYDYPFVHLYPHLANRFYQRLPSRVDSILDSDFVYKISCYDNIISTKLNSDDLATPDARSNNDGKVSIFEFRDKVVGLYLCYDGTFIRTLDLISRECRARNQDFQVIMVYLPYEESVNPLFFMKAINQVLRNLNISSSNSSWWVSPFDDSVSRRIWEIYDYFEQDKLIIFDPSVNYADPYARVVFGWYGIDAYPFRREFLVRKKVEAVRAVTLTSFLGYGSRDYVLRMTFNNDICNVDEVPIAKLHGKTVLVYATWSLPSDIYFALLDWYYWNKTRLSDVEVVILCTKDEQNYSTVPATWLVCPYDKKYLFSVMEAILLNRDEDLIAYDKDGHVITIDALELLDSYGPKGFPSFEWYAGLRNEFICQYHRLFDLGLEDLYD